ncbi:PAS domain-containing protein [Gemmata sp. G18]|uniref:histidine kinase n=1 Tax=Gemmata palustris TaxID=2822762 RepID=A0ABS5C1K7_9BACT|nr:ATP-binding protein [Gemmata palustris]MBP3959857.1 PAS domain-containing protein [Gemmata palustris]
MGPDVVPIVRADAFELSRLCRYFSERSPQPMVAVEGAAHIVRYFNPAFGRLAGKSSAELIGHPFAEAVPEGGANGCLPLLDRVFRTGEPESLAEQEHRQVVPAHWSYSMWAVLGADEIPVGVVIQVTDATEVAAFRHRTTAMNEALMVSSVRQHELIDAIERGERERQALQAQMFQAQKMESLGVLAGGLAHDLNNMLTPVLGFTELVQNALPIDSPAATMLEFVSGNAQRATDLVGQILAYAGKGQFVIQPVNLSTLVRETSGRLSAAVSAGTELRYELAPDLPPIEGDATQLRQVVVNLVTNASEALGPDRGVVTVRTGPVPAGAPSGMAVFLEVEDSGCGMSASVIEKAFDPFFTTKFTGRGLGLAVVQGVTHGHGGTLEVRSAPDRGSTFRLLLPCTTGAAAALVAPHPLTLGEGP